MHLKNLKGQSRSEIAKALPNAIRTVLQSYRTFIAREEIGGAKEFKSHHDACKVAIAHLDLLTKLAVWVSEQAEEGMEHNDFARMIEAAQQEIDENKGKAHE